MPDGPKILSTHPLHPRAEAMLAGAGRLVVASSLDAVTLTREAEDAEIVIVRAPLPATLFDSAARLRAAIRHGAGLDMIPLDAATRAGVLVANVPGVNARTVAEHVFFVTLALLRRFRAMDHDLRTSGWLSGRDHANLTNDLTGRTIGVVGTGNVGREVARIATHGFGLTVLANNRSGKNLPEGARFAAIDALVAHSDVVVLCCPLSPETTGLINASRIGAMKPTALLVNVSRGPVVDETALTAALREHRIAGAALDVFVSQPLPSDDPFFTFPNVIVTPHMAGITEESMERMGVGAAAETLSVLDGALPVNLVNPEAVERYRSRFA
ncbi:MAG: NAD(P)-dependent oxidoreductase [Mesorhizobium sp.]|jgi:D-3-phosphoglycerate dehydrogenase / 2-oxoglutarate reductase